MLLQVLMQVSHNLRLHSSAALRLLRSPPPMVVESSIFTVIEPVASGDVLFPLQDGKKTTRRQRRIDNNFTLFITFLLFSILYMKRVAQKNVAVNGYPLFLRSFLFQRKFKFGCKYGCKYENAADRFARAHSFRKQYDTANGRPYAFKREQQNSM